MKIKLPQTAMKAEYVAFHGGLDVNSPPISIPAGYVRQSKNYEEDVNSGYITMKGYERYNGKTSPSTATFAVLAYTVRGTFELGDTITGATSAATGTIIAITSTDFIITNTTGTFVSEATTTDGATIVGPAYINARSGEAAAIYRNLAADVYRGLIAAVPGAGSILGVYYFKGLVYAFRNTATTGVKMFKSSTSGWVDVAFGFEVYYAAGTGAEPAVGATISQGGVSGALAAITIESGSFGAGTAAGRLIFATITAGPFVAGAFTGGITANAVSQAAITIPNQNGRFSFITANFYGQLQSTRMYGCDGANRGFEFDGTTFIPINTGTPVDFPLHVAEHAKHLFFSFGSSAIHSSLGDPHNWTTTLGASEIAVSDTVTGFMPQPGSDASPALAIYCRNTTYLLYGSDSTDWQLIKYNESSGAIAYSIQKIGQTFVMDDRGITTLSTSQNFGNFAEAAVSERVKTLLNTKRSQLIDSHVARDKQQYRLFFSDKTALYCTITKKYVAIMPMLFAHKVTCSVSEETYGGGAELVFFGSDNGYVYQMEKGTSHDGERIEAYIYLTYNHSNSYRTLKKYRRLTFEMIGIGYSEFKSSYDLSFGLDESAQSDTINQLINSSAPLWDNMTWDNFIWDGRPLNTLSMSTPGDGENISIKIYSISDYFSPVKFSGVFVEFSPLRMQR